MIKICHLTSVHPRYDIRIFLKECKSLTKAGYDVSLIVADGKGDETITGIKIYDVGKSNGRLQRMLKSTKKVFQKAKLIDADIYHFHDPELIMVGLKLKKSGKIVIFDSHEDVPKQILSKPYLSKIVLKILSKFVAIYERRVCKRFDAIIAATPIIRNKFLSINKNTVNVNNFPILDELFDKNTSAKKENTVCYIGGITKIRGIEEIVTAMEFVQTDIKLVLAGIFDEKETENKVKQSSGWSKVEELGFVNRKGICNILSQSVAGLVTFLPYPNHIESQPNKIFEYMSAGIPVIASDFPLWKEIIAKNNCGICVNPSNPKEIAEAVDYLVKNPENAEEMGKNGRKAVEQFFNWKIEEKKLLELYLSL